jgi:hypothetical protein
MTCKPSVVASVPATIVHIHPSYPVKQRVLAVWQVDRSHVSHVDLCAAEHYTSVHVRRRLLEKAARLPAGRADVCRTPCLPLSRSQAAHMQSVDKAGGRGACRREAEQRDRTCRRTTSPTFIPS